MPRKWTAEDVLVMSRGFQCSCVLVAAAELELFDLLANESLTAGDVAGRISADQRATTVLLDALAALGLLDKQAQRYAVPAEVGALLTADGARSVLAMVQHQGNCLRRWVQLPAVVLSGAPAEARPSVRGEAADKAAFIGAMDNISGPVADEVIQAAPLEFKHLLDVGGGLGTWTLAFLRAVPAARATLFDLPHVIPLARQRIDAAGLGDRVALVAGDFYTDPLPAGAVRSCTRTRAARTAPCSPACSKRLRPAGTSPSATFSWTRRAPARRAGRCLPSTCWSPPKAAARSPSKSWPTIWRPQALPTPPFGAVTSG